MKIHASGEDYLEAVLILQKKQGMVRSVDLARHMGFSKPSISHAVGVSFALKWNDALAASAAYRREPPMIRSDCRQILTVFSQLSKKSILSSGYSLTMDAKIVAF